MMLKANGAVAAAVTHPPIVFIRGLLLDRRFWRGFPDRFEGWQTHAPDMPGAGLGDAERFPMRMDRLLAPFRAECKSATGADRFLLVGHSLGGMLALEWLGRHPEEVLGVATLNSSSGHWLRGPFGRLNQVNALRLLPQILRRKKDAAKFVMLLTNHPEEAEAEANRAEWQDLLDAGCRGLGLMVRQFISVMNWRPRIAPPYDSRVLLTVGSADGFTPNSGSHRLQKQLPGASMFTLPGGHELFADHGPELATAIELHFEALLTREEE
jgi:pimeloyl-ACP methyl ester carboxylesterase